MRAILLNKIKATSRKTRLCLCVISVGLVCYFCNVPTVGGLVPLTIILIAVICEGCMRQAEKTRQRAWLAHLDALMADAKDKLAAKTAGTIITPAGSR